MRMASTVTRDLPATRWVLVFLFLCAPLLFASNMVAARWLSGLVPPVTLGFGRWLVAALVLLPVAWAPLRQGMLRRAPAGILALLALLGGVVSVAPQYGAAAYSSAGNIALIAAMSPLLVVLIERVMWGVRLRLPAVLGIGCACAGIAVSTFRGDLAAVLRLELNPGDALMLFAMLAWAGYTALLRHRPVGLPPMLLLWVVAAGGALGMAPLMLLEWSRLGVPHLGPQAVTGIVFLGLVAGVGAYAIFGRVVSQVGAARASMSMYLIPAYALALGATLLGESLHAYHAVAMALVLGGVAIGTLHIPVPGRLRGRFAST